MRTAHLLSLSGWLTDILSLILDQYKLKLESIGKEESLAITMSNLVEKVKEMKIRRLQIATRIKVQLFSNSCCLSIAESSELLL